MIEGSGPITQDETTEQTYPEEITDEIMTRINDTADVFAPQELRTEIQTLIKKSLDVAYANAIKDLSKGKEE